MYRNPIAIRKIIQEFPGPNFIFGDFSNNFFEDGNTYFRRETLGMRLQMTGEFDQYNSDEKAPPLVKKSSKTRGGFVFDPNPQKNSSLRRDFTTFLNDF